MTDPIREATFERSLPNSSEAERAILGAIILDQGLVAQAIELLTPEDFYVPSHRRIYVAMVAIFERGGQIDPILIGEELKKENALETVGGISFITNLTYGLPHSTDITHYAKVVKGKATLRRLIKTCAHITNEALEEEDESEAILDNAERLIFEIAENRLRGKLIGVESVARDVLDRIQAQDGHAGFLLGLTTGFADLDEKTSGMQKQDLIIVAARPSMGKTSFALMLTENACIAKPETVAAIFSLEMSKEALVMRMICQQANVDAQRFRNGFLSRAEWTVIAKALGSLTDMKIFLDDTPGISVLELRAKAMRLKAEQKRLDLIVVDYLQLMNGMGDKKRRVESRQQEVALITRNLKELAKEFDCPVVALSQLSRAPENRSDHRPQLSDLRETGEIEQTADTVEFLYREEVYKTPEERQNMPDDKRNVCEVILAKQRNGPTGTVELRFVPSSMRFDNVYLGEHQQGLPARDWHQ